ncbi:MAG: hypothetical protein U0936_00620 [Planctomycetaceae bacterium]
MRHSQSFLIALLFALVVSWTPCRLTGDEPKNLQDDSTTHFRYAKSFQYRNGIASNAMATKNRKRICDLMDTGIWSTPA